MAIECLGGFAYSILWMTASLTPIRVVTCEDRASPRYAIEPLWPGATGNPLQFRVQDPFGIRRGIMPVFLGTPTGQLVGVGTAFHIDSWGTLLTADHVIDGLREKRPFGSFQEGTEQVFDMGPENIHAHVLLGGVVVYGRARLPDGMVTRIMTVKSQICKLDDPLAELQGQPNTKIAVDIASLKTEIVPQAAWRATFPIRVNGWRPNLGDTVVAVGFPEITSEVLNEKSAVHILGEGMYAAYGKITRAYPQGRDKANPTPVIEVEADWPAGMSGAPVFNNAGEVIGIVSHSLKCDDEGSPGIGWAACFQLVPNLGHLMPAIDPYNTCNRLGWAVLNRKPWDLAAFCETETEAREILKFRGDEYELLFGSNRVGTDDFVQANIPDVI